MSDHTTKLRHTLTDAFVRLESEERLLVHVSLDVMRSSPEAAAAVRALFGAAVESIGLAAALTEK